MKCRMCDNLAEDHAHSLGCCSASCARAWSLQMVADWMPCLSAMPCLSTIVFEERETLEFLDIVDLSEEVSN